MENIVMADRTLTPKSIFAKLKMGKPHITYMPHAVLKYKKIKSNMNIAPPMNLGNGPVQNK